MKKTFNEMWQELEQSENGEVFKQVFEVNDETMAVIKELVERNNRLTGRVSRLTRQNRRLKTELKDIKFGYNITK